MVKNRLQQSVQRCERELCLRLDCGAAEHLHVGSALACIFEKRRLADAGLAADDEHAALRRARTIEKRFDARSFRASLPYSKALIGARRFDRDECAPPCVASGLVSWLSPPHSGAIAWIQGRRCNGCLNCSGTAAP